MWCHCAPPVVAHWCARRELRRCLPLAVFNLAWMGALAAPTTKVRAHTEQTPERKRVISVPVCFHMFSRRGRSQNVNIPLGPRRRSGDPGDGTRSTRHDKKSSHTYLLREVARRCSHPPPHDQGYRDVLIIVNKELAPRSAERGGRGQPARCRVVSVTRKSRSESQIGCDEQQGEHDA